MPPRNIRDLIAFIGTEEDDLHERMERIFSLREMNAMAREESRMKLNEITAPGSRIDFLTKSSKNPKR